MDKRRTVLKVAQRHAERRIKIGDPSIGHGPDQWWLNKEYRPFEGDLGHNDNLPVGRMHPLEKVRFHDLEEEHSGRMRQPDMDVETNMNTIEMALNRSDMSKDHMEGAMSFLPHDLDGFYDYLRQIGMEREILVIKQLLNWY